MTCDVGSTYPGGGENRPSLLHGNVKVIYESKTVKAFFCCVCRDGLGTVLSPKYRHGTLESNEGSRRGKETN